MNTKTFDENNICLRFHAFIILYFNSYLSFVIEPLRQRIERILLDFPRKFCSKMVSRALLYTG
jgi:hypothetical protein